MTIAKILHRLGKVRQVIDGTTSWDFPAWVRGTHHAGWPPNRTWGRQHCRMLCKCAVAYEVSHWQFVWSIFPALLGTKKAQPLGGRQAKERLAVQKPPAKCMHFSGSPLTEDCGKGCLERHSKSLWQASCQESNHGSFDWFWIGDNCGPRSSPGWGPQGASMTPSSFAVPWLLLEGMGCLFVVQPGSSCRWWHDPGFGKGTWYLGAPARRWCISRVFFFMLLMVGKSWSFSFESGEDRIAIGCGGGKQFINCRYFRLFLPVLGFLYVSFNCWLLFCKVTLFSWNLFLLCCKNETWSKCMERMRG